MVKLYGFCIARRHHPYIESLPTLWYIGAICFTKLWELNKDLFTTIEVGLGYVQDHQTMLHPPTMWTFNMQAEYFSHSNCPGWWNYICYPISACAKQGNQFVNLFINHFVTVSCEIWTFFTSSEQQLKLIIRHNILQPSDFPRHSQKHGSYPLAK